MLSRRSLIILGLLLGIGIAVLAGTPLLIKHLATRWLLDNGGDRVQFEDVDFNPFTAQLVLKRLSVVTDEETALDFDSVTADLAWAPLWHRQVSISSLTFNGFDILVDDRSEDALLLGGIRLPRNDGDAEAPASEGQPWLAGIGSLQLTDFDIRFQNAELDLALHLDRLALDNMHQWEPESETRLAASGTLNGAPFEINGQLAPLAKTPRYTADISLSGLPLEMFATLAQDSAARLNGFVSYQGDVRFTQQADGIRLAQNGTIGLQSLDISAIDPKVRVLNKSTQLSGNLDLASSEAGGQTIKLNYNAELQGLHIVAEDQTLELIRADKLTLSDLALDGPEKIAIAGIGIDNFSFGRSATDKAEDAFIDVAHFKVAQLDLENNVLSVGEVHYQNGTSYMKRDPDGNFRVVGIIDSMNRLTEKDSGTGAEEKLEKPASTGNETALAVKVGRIDVSGDNKIIFVDESVKPAFNTEVRIKSFLVENLDTRKPQQASPFKLAGGIGEYTGIEMEGQAQPFLEPPGVDMKADITALDLPPLSSYTSDSLGLVLDSGTLDADASLKVGQQTMDGKVRLKLHQLELENVESENSLQSKLPVPLNVALDTLRDKHNTISLEIPVKGDPANPDFSINDALSQALASGVQKGALTYLSLALQPYGSLIAAARYAGEEISKVRLKPVEFDAGQSAIDDSDKDYLAKVANVLKERPKLNIKLCGVSTRADSEYLQQQAMEKAKATKENKPAQSEPAPVDEATLQTLARARAASVKDYMIANFKIPATRLVGCRPRLETDDSKSLPRTDLLI